MFESASFHVTGAPAVLLILVILALLVVGAVTVVRVVKRESSET